MLAEWARERFRLISAVLLVVCLVLASVVWVQHQSLGQTRRNGDLAECILSALLIAPEDRTVDLLFSVCPDVGELHLIDDRIPPASTTTLATTTTGTVPATTSPPAVTTTPRPPRTSNPPRTTTVTRPPSTTRPPPPTTSPPTTQPPAPPPSMDPPCRTPTVPVIGACPTVP